MPYHTDRLTLSLFVALLAGCSEPATPPVSFAPSGDGYDSKMDFARLEQELPVTPRDLMTITPENLKAATQEQVDQIYARLSAGPIPDGAYVGELLLPKGNSGQTRISEIGDGGLKGLTLKLGSAHFETIARLLGGSPANDGHGEIVRRVPIDHSDRTG